MKNRTVREILESVWDMAQCHSRVSPSVKPGGSAIFIGAEKELTRRLEAVTNDRELVCDLSNKVTQLEGQLLTSREQVGRLQNKNENQLQTIQFYQGERRRLTDALRQTIYRAKVGLGEPFLPHEEGQ